MTRESFIAHSELTNEIYIVIGKEKYCVTEQAIKAVMAIKALEQQPCEDAVSRAELLKLYENRFIELQKAHQMDKQLGINWCINTLNDLRSVTPTRKEERWISCSQKLPKEDEYDGDIPKYYLVQNEYGDMLVAQYTHSGYWEQIYQLKPISDEIVAWMELPKSYKPETEKQHATDCKKSIRALRKCANEHKKR